MPTRAKPCFFITSNFYERTIDSHVKNLRAKLGDDPRNPRWLYTVHGVGYRFEAATSEASE